MVPLMMEGDASCAPHCTVCLHVNTRTGMKIHSTTAACVPQPSPFVSLLLYPACLKGFLFQFEEKSWSTSKGLDRSAVKEASISKL